MDSQGKSQLGGELMSCQANMCRRMSLIQFPFETTRHLLMPVALRWGVDQDLLLRLGSVECGVTT